MTTRLGLIHIAVLLALPAGAVAQTVPAPTTTSPQMPSTMPPADVRGDRLKLTDDQSRAWLKKAVYSSDEKNIGEVEVIARDATGTVTEMHADIGGFLGLGETRVRLMPDQFRLAGDRVILTLTADQAKSLPPLKK